MIPQVGGFQGCYLDNHRNNWRCVVPCAVRVQKPTLTSFKHVSCHVNQAWRRRQEVKWHGGTGTCGAIRRASCAVTQPVAQRGHNLVDVFIWDRQGPFQRLCRGCQLYCTLDLWERETFIQSVGHILLSTRTQFGRG